MQECPACRVVNTDLVTNCESCGRSLGVPSNGVHLATFWERTKALWLDGMLLVIPSLVLRSLGLRNVNSVGFQIAWALTAWVYFAAMESSRWQATLGKRLIGLRVTDLSGNRISFTRASGRFFASGISSIFGLGYLMALFTWRRQTLHDILASCLVWGGPAGK